MEIFGLLVVLAACWSSGNVAWSWFAGGRRALLQTWPSLGSAALATCVILYPTLSGDSDSTGYHVACALTVVAFVFSDLLPPWVRKQVNVALNAGALDRAAAFAGWAGGLPHPTLKLEPLSREHTVEVIESMLGSGALDPDTVVEELQRKEKRHGRKKR